MIYPCRTLAITAGLIVFVSVLGCFHKDAEETAIRQAIKDLNISDIPDTHGRPKSMWSDKTSVTRVILVAKEGGDLICHVVHEYDRVSNDPLASVAIIIVDKNFDASHVANALLGEGEVLLNCNAYAFLVHDDDSGLLYAPLLPIIFFDKFETYPWTEALFWPNRENLSSVSVIGDAKALFVRVKGDNSYVIEGDGTFRGNEVGGRIEYYNDTRYFGVALEFSQNATVGEVCDAIFSARSCDPVPIFLKFSSGVSTNEGQGKQGSEKP